MEQTLTLDPERRPSISQAHQFPYIKQSTSKVLLSEFLFRNKEKMSVSYDSENDLRHSMISKNLEEALGIKQRDLATQKGSLVST